MNVLQSSLSDLSEHFYKKMADFEAKLHPQSVSSPSTSSPDLAAEFAVFRAFITEAVSGLQKQIEVLSHKLDHMEMHGRRKMLLFHGVVEQKQENTFEIVADILKKHFSLNTVSVHDIKWCNRMRQPSARERARPILVKFHDFSFRNKIWFSKSQLKRTGITVSEFLTKQRHDVFMAARDKFGVTNSWTKEGTVYVLGSDGKRHRVYCRRQLIEIDRHTVETVPVQTAAKPNTASVAPKLKRAAARK